jgi:hypothetical protein
MNCKKSTLLKNQIYLITKNFKIDKLKLIEKNI